MRGATSGRSPERGRATDCRSHRRSPADVNWLGSVASKNRAARAIAERNNNVVLNASEEYVR